MGAARPGAEAASEGLAPPQSSAPCAPAFPGRFEPRGSGGARPGPARSRRAPGQRHRPHRPPARGGARVPPPAKHPGSCSPLPQRRAPAAGPAAPRRLPPPLPPAPSPAGGSRRPRPGPEPPLPARPARPPPSASSARRPSGLVVPPRYSRRPLRCFRAVAPGGRDGALRHGGGVRAGSGTPGQAGPAAEREEDAGGAAGRRGGREGVEVALPGGKCGAGGGREQQRGRLHPQVSGGGGRRGPPGARGRRGRAARGLPPQPRGPRLPPAAAGLAPSRPEPPAGPRPPPGRPAPPVAGGPEPGGRREPGLEGGEAGVGGGRCRGPAAGASRECRLGGLRPLRCLSGVCEVARGSRLPSSDLGPAARPDRLLTNLGVVGSRGGSVHPGPAVPYLPAPGPGSAHRSRLGEVEPPGSPVGQVSPAYGT